MKNQKKMNKEDFLKEFKREKLEQSENPTDYNWSTGWSKTYQEHLNEQQA